MAKEKYEIINAKTFSEARSLISKAKEKIIFSSNDDDLIRQILEKEKISVLLLNQKQRKPKVKQEDSGLNHILAKLAKEKNIAIGINLDEILSSKGKEKAEILSKVKQNIKLCSKAKLRMIFISLEKDLKNKKDPYDLKSLASALGMPTWMLIP